MDNKKISDIFQEMGDIIDIQGGNFFRSNAYKRAALTILNTPQDLIDIVEKNPNSLKDIPGIGQDLQRKIIELVQTGKCDEHEKLKKQIPEGLLEMLRLRGVGPKKVKLFYGELRIKNIRELKEAAEKHVLRDLPKMGEKSEHDILSAIEEYSHFSPNRALISEALSEAVRIIKFMKKCPGVDKIEYAGSLRRKQETIGDIDILVTSKSSHSAEIMKHFVSYDDILDVTAHGDTKSSIVLQGGMNADLRVVDNNSFGAALHYFTGSKEHNIRIRDLAKRKGLKINEYGVFKGEKSIGGKDENDIFKAVGLPFIIPELRKNDGEIEYGLKNKSFPEFIELKDIKGDLHTHSTYSDGKLSIEEMAKAAIANGYEYFAISDHSSVLGITHGMGSKDIMRQWIEVDKLNKKFKGKITILKGSEVDILKDGSLDFSDDILKKLDIVIASAHSYMMLDYDTQTKRILAAVENPNVKILGHPSGRLLNKRAAMHFDMEKVIDACIKNRVAIEINSNPQRLDLVDKYVRIAKDKGAYFVINTDSHNDSQLNFMQFGIGVARRGWLTKSNVLNTRNLKDLTVFFK